MKKILVLEDEASIRSFIVINLRRAGYDVIEAESGEEALERLRANPDVKVALLDIMLPGIDGFEVCRRIRATNTKIGIIMLTARSQEMSFAMGEPMLTLSPLWTYSSLMVPLMVAVGLAASDAC